MMIVIFIFLLGLAVGSFLNAWIWRLRAGKSVARGRSHCPGCGHTLAWQDLIPVLSFILLRGKCRYCRKKIDIQYPLVELATAVLFVIAYLVNNFQFSIFPATAGSRIPLNIITIMVRDNFQLWLDWFFIAILIVVFVYDLRYLEIPDKVTIPAITIGIVLQIISNFSRHSGIPQTFGFLNTQGAGQFSIFNDLVLQIFVPILIGGGFFLLQYVVSRGRWIGGGDIRLGALMGVVLGLPGILIGLALAYVAGSVIAIMLVVRGRKTMQSQIAFGTFLSAATIMTMLWGDRIGISW